MLCTPLKQKAFLIWELGRRMEATNLGLWGRHVPPRLSPSLWIRHCCCRLIFIVLLFVFTTSSGIVFTLAA